MSKGTRDEGGDGRAGERKWWRGKLEGAVLARGSQQECGCERLVNTVLFGLNWRTSTASMLVAVVAVVAAVVEVAVAVVAAAAAAVLMKGWRVERRWGRNNAYIRWW